MLAACGLAGWAGRARADGFHAEVLTSNNPAAWSAASEQQLQAIAAAPGGAAPQGNVAQAQAVRNAEELKRKLAGQGGAAGGALADKRARLLRGVRAENLNANQRALVQQKSQEYATMLAYLDPQNIIPAEFPAFPVQQVGAYRASAKKLLTLTGEVGSDVVVNALRAQLMSSGRGGLYGMKFHDRYGEDLLEVLQNLAARGDLRGDHLEALRGAVQGAAGGPNAGLARKIGQLLPDLADTSIQELLKWARQAGDDGNAARRGELLEAVKVLTQAAPIGELVKLSGSDQVDAQTKRMAENEVARRLGQANLQELIQVAAIRSDAGLRRRAVDALLQMLAQADVADLLEILDLAVDEDLLKAAAAQIQTRSPRFAEVRDRMEEILQHARSERPFVVRAAQEQIANAFQRAPIDECLVWLGRDDPPVNELIWKQIEGRIDRADAQRRGGYRDAAIAALDDPATPSRSRGASLELLGRLGDTASITVLVERLPKLPRDLWPAAGKALQRATGQNYGPRPGDGLADVVSAARKYRQWLDANPGR